SRYRPLDEAAKLVSPLNFDKTLLFFIHGLALGYHVDQILDRASSDAILVCFEPDPRTLKTALWHRDFSKPLADRRLILLPPPPLPPSPPTRQTPPSPPAAPPAPPWSPPPPNPPATPPASSSTPTSTPKPPAGPRNLPPSPAPASTPPSSTAAAPPKTSPATS